MQKYLSRVEFWIALFFVVRLIGITNPPLEAGHNWRQVTGLMVARNFVEVDASILYPRVDDNNGASGIIGMEFPLMNYLYFVVAECFGYTHWYGRLLNLIVSSFGLFYFSKIVSRFFDQRVALASTILLASSIWFAFSRKMMPDTFCVSLMFVGLYYALRYLDHRRWLDLFLYTTFVSLAMLSKIPAGIYLGVVFVAIAAVNTNVKYKSYLGIATLPPLAVVYFWYFVWNVQLSQEYGNWYNLGKPFLTGLTELTSNLNKVLENFYFNSFSSYLAFLCVVAGLVLMIKDRKKFLFIAFLSVFIPFLVYMAKSGFYFYHHSYYIIPFVPVMALVAGYGVSKIRNSWVFSVLLLLCTIESIANQQHDFFVKDSERYKMKLEAVADSLSDRNDLIAINGNGNPQLIYLSHRKGWNCDDSQLSDSLYVQSLADKGCRYLFINKHTFTGELKWPVVYSDFDFSIYRTGEAKPVKQAGLPLRTK
jgi:hypothetical protein